MKIAVIGTGYVGLVTGTCFADKGNHVTCVDIDREKIARLNEGVIPIYEPGLSELVRENVEDKRLHFTTDLQSAVQPADLIFLAVGTPSADDGSASLASLWKVVQDIAPHLRHDAIVVTKSTVPVGTNSAIFARLREWTGRECDVASNPEFLKEGAALEDFRKPDRVVVGVRRAAVAAMLHELYEPFLRNENPFMVMSPESAEMTKYAANAMLATKISFINEVANLCERKGADIGDVRKGIGSDSRIGNAFLYAGVGYGGSCFPKDVRALQYTAREAGMELEILKAVETVNLRQKSVLGTKIARHFDGQLADKTIAVWGLAFKPCTDDTREAPALVLIDWLLSQGVRVQVHDPKAMESIQQVYGEKLIYAEDPYDALNGADALAIVTNWEEFSNLDFDEIHRRMKTPVVFDGRNMYKPQQMKTHGISYHSIGRASV